MKRAFLLLTAAAAVFCFLSLNEDLTAAGPKTVNVFEKANLNDFGFHLVDGAKKEDVFSIKDGVLTVKGKPFGWLETKAHYRNFTVKGEFRYPDPANAANSGLFIRGKRIADKSAFLPRTVECQLQPKTCCDLMTFFDMPLAGPADRSSVVNPHKVTKVLRKVERFNDGIKGAITDWQKIEVYCFENVIVVRLNGEVVNYADNVDNVAGFIAFQSEGGLIQFRNFTITEE